MLPLLLVALVLSADPPTDAGEAGPSVVEPLLPSVTLRVGVELGVTSFPSGTPGGGQDALLGLSPILGVGVGEDFAAELGAELRLRLIDSPPEQRSTDIGGVLRRADWDEASDFGQLIRSLQIGKPDNVFWIQAGAVRRKTLGLGHLISRYSNQDNPDYHPAGATLGVGYKAFHGELFASDIFGARIFAGELVADLGRIFSNSEGSFDRFHVAVSAAHDAGRAGYVAAEVTLLQLDVDAVVFRNDIFQVMVLAGVGARTAASADYGLLVGFSLDAMLEGGFSIGGKLELRKQRFGFRQGFIGAGYELSRFAGTGFSGPARAAELLPDDYSGAGELRVANGTAVSLDLAVEYFAWGRADLDALLALELIGHRVVGGARFTAIGLGKVPRYALTSELRVRLFSSFYVMGAGGTVFFPQPDGTLARGVYVGAGAGLDFER